MNAEGLIQFENRIYGLVISFRFMILDHYKII